MYGEWYLQGAEFHMGMVKCANSSCTDGCAMPKTYLKLCLVFKAHFKEESYIMCKLYLNYGTINIKVIGVNLRSLSKGYWDFDWNKQHSLEDKGSAAPLLPLRNEGENTEFHVGTVAATSEGYAYLRLCWKGFLQVFLSYLISFKSLKSYCMGSTDSQW